MPNDSNAPAAPATDASAATPATAAPAAAAPDAAAAPAAAPAAGEQAPASAEQKPAEGEQKPADAQKPAVPENYEFTAPEGVKLDDTVMTAFAESAKEAGLSQEAAQALVTKMAPTLAAQTQAQMEQSMAAARTEWATSAKADTEFGGEKFDANIAVAKQAFETFGTPELKQLLADSGLGDHPEVIRWAYRVGKAMSPDTKHVSGGNANAAKDARSWFPNSNHSA